jgi:RNA polymerase sigma factor (sigma-70 family)
VARREETTGASAPKTDGPHPGWSDERLVGACLDGNEQAWSALIDKYKHLIYSIPIRYGASPEDAADIFQSVCLELFSELPRLRKTTALRSWLITVAAHQSFHWKRKFRRQAYHETTDVQQHMEDEAGFEINSAMPSDDVEQVEREQMVREATARLSPRCQEMIRLLFYVEPTVPYREVARRLGLATGSIGFIRGRCLERLQKILQQMGF